MLFTSYFANTKKMPPNMFPVAICLSPPKEFRGANYAKLAPDFDILWNYKQDKDQGAYTKAYQEKILRRLNPDEVLEEIRQMLPESMKLTLTEHRTMFWNDTDVHVALVCFEKDGDFCHRHLVADWLRDKAWVKIEEWHPVKPGELDPFQIARMIQEGKIVELSAEPTDSEGKTVDAVYRWKKQTYPVSLSWYENEPYELQAARQIVEQMKQK